MKQVANWRRRKSTRILLIVLLLAIVGLIAYMFEKTRWIMLGAAVLLFTALGLEVTENDLDLGKLWETGSISASKVARSEDGNLILGVVCDEGNVFNCADFANQAEAQEAFEACNWGGNDVHGLDRDKNGIACQGLAN